MVSGEDGAEGQAACDGAAVRMFGSIPPAGSEHFPENGEVPLTPETELLADVVATLKDRGRQYGPPSDHHARTAQAVEAILGVSLTPAEVALFFAIDKMVRRRTTPKKKDHYEDIEGYVAIAWGHEERGCE